MRALTPGKHEWWTISPVNVRSAGDKQFITVVTKGGNYFYIIIDRAEGGENDRPLSQPGRRARPAGLTPDGNLSGRSTIGGSTGAAQFITVETKNGNVFYLIIDRDDEGEETVHFLNQVDEADLLTLMGDDACRPGVYL